MIIFYKKTYWNISIKNLFFKKKKYRGINSFWHWTEEKTFFLTSSFQILKNKNIAFKKKLIYKYIMNTNTGFKSCLLSEFQKRLKIGYKA